MLNVTDHYCISPATSKGGFPVIRVICHESVIYVTGHVSHGSLPLVTRQSETFSLPSLPLALFYPREWRVCPHLCWDNVLVYLVFLALYANLMKSHSRDQSDCARRRQLTFPFCC